MSQKTILLVDDEPLSRDIYRVMLEECGYAVLEAGDGGEAVLLARSELPDLIVMNLTMPALTGMDATELLKMDAGTRRIPVLILTGHVAPGIEALAWESGCDDYLIKPLSPRALADEIERRIGPPVNAGS